MSMQQMLLGGGPKPIDRYWYNTASGTVTKQEDPINGSNISGLGSGWGYGTNKFDGLAIKLSGTGTWKMTYFSHGSIVTANTSGTTLNPHFMIHNGEGVDDTILYQKQDNFVVGNDQTIYWSVGIIAIPETDDNGNGIPTLNRGSWYTIGTLAPSNYSGYSTSYRNQTLPNVDSNDVSTKTFDHNGETITIYLKKPDYPGSYSGYYNGTDKNNGGVPIWGFDVD